jgi:hypothetical protein
MSSFELSVRFSSYITCIRQFHRNQTNRQAKQCDPREISVGHIGMHIFLWGGAQRSLGLLSARPQTLSPGVGEVRVEKLPLSIPTGMVEGHSRYTDRVSTKWYCSCTGGQIAGCRCWLHGITNWGETVGRLVSSCLIFFVFFFY